MCFINIYYYDKFNQSLTEENQPTSSGDLQNPAKLNIHTQHLHTLYLNIYSRTFDICN